MELSIDLGSHRIRVVRHGARCSVAFEAAAGNGVFFPLDATPVTDPDSLDLAVLMHAAGAVREAPAGVHTARVEFRDGVRRYASSVCFGVPDGDDLAATLASGAPAMVLCDSVIDAALHAVMPRTSLTPARRFFMLAATVARDLPCNQTM